MDGVDRPRRLGLWCWWGWRAEGTTRRGDLIPSFIKWQSSLHFLHPSPLVEAHFCLTLACKTILPTTKIQNGCAFWDRQQTNNSSKERPTQPPVRLWYQWDDWVMVSDSLIEQTPKTFCRRFLVKEKEYASTCRSPVSALHCSIHLQPHAHED